MKESFVLRVLAILFIFLALPLLIVCFVLFQTDYQDAVAHAKKEIEAAALVRTYSIYQIKPFSLNFVGEVAYYLDLRNNWDPSPEMNQKLKRISELGDRTIDLSLMKKGENKGEYLVLASNKPENLGTTFVSYHHLPSIETGGLQSFVRTVYSQQKQRYEFYIYVAHAILDKNKALLGYLVVDSNIDTEIDLILKQGKETHPNDSFAVLQEDGVICAATSPGLIGGYFKPLSPQTVEKFLIETHQTKENAVLASQPFTTKWEKNSHFFEFNYENETKLGYLPPLATAGVSVLGYSNKNQVFRAALHRFLFFYAAYGILLLFGGFITYWLSLLMARPLHQLGGLFKKFEQGDLQGRFREELFGYEINSLGHIFNETIDAFLENIKKVENYRITKETHQKELEIGYEVQRRLLPGTMPDIPGMESYALYCPTYIAGGDFYDFIEKEGKFYFFIGDTATKGITPCLYALIVRSLIRSYLFVEKDVGKILTSANALFCKDTGESGIFVTVIMGCFDPKTKILKYYSCGHPPGILRKANGHIELLTHRGMAIGLREIAEYHEESIQLENGDLLLFATDGLYRSTNEKYQYFSLERVIDALQHRNWVRAEETVQGIVKEVKAFRQKREESEITVLCLRVLDPKND